MRYLLLILLLLTGALNGATASTVERCESPCSASVATHHHAPDGTDCVHDGAAPGMGFRLVKAERDQQPEAAAVFAPSPVVVRLEARAAPHPRFWTARTPIEPPQLAIIRITRLLI